MEQNNQIQHYTMEKTYEDLKRECTNKEFCLEAALSEYIDNTIQSVLDDYNKKNFDNSDYDVVDLLETCDEIQKQKIIEDLKKYNLKIDFIFSSKKQNNNETSIYSTLKIRDNACGIENSDLRRCMDTNKTIERKKKNSMHYFGIGMKISSFWLGDNAVIYTKTKNEDFVSIGNYNSLDKNLVFKRKEKVAMSIQKSYDYQLLSQIGESGTIIEIQKLQDSIKNKMFDKNTYDIKNLSNKNKDLYKTLGMKYSNYLKHEILKINLIFEAPNKETVIQNVPSFSLNQYDVSSEKDCNPFIISKFYENNLKEQQEIYPSVDYLQNYLNNELVKLATDEKNKLIANLFNSNDSDFKYLFSDINKPVKFKMNCKINGTDKTFPITIGFLNKGEQKFSNVNITAQWRYIHLPCFAQNNQIIHQYVLNSNWEREKVTCKWSYIEFNLRDLPDNQNFELFTPDRNKTEIIEVNTPGIEHQYSKEDFKKSLTKIKEELIPLTNLIKNLDFKNAAGIKKKKTANDIITQKIIMCDEDKIEYKTKNNINKISFDRFTKAEDKLIDKINDNEYVVYSNNNIFELKDEVDSRTIALLKISNDYFNDLKSIRNWVQKNEWIKSFNNFDEVNEILNKYDEVQDIGDYIKNE